MSAGTPVTTVDAVGLRCPLPVIRLARAAKDLPAGTVVEVLSTDAAAPGDIGAWCRMRGHVLVSTGPAPRGTDASPGTAEVTRTVVEVRGTPPEPAR